VSVLVEKGVRRTLLSMAVPMLAGTFAMNAYNLTDTWFVSRLGTLPLAAMGFTFPVVMLLSCVAGGLGTGVTTLMSHALGRRDTPAAATITSIGLLLVLGVAAVLAAAGYLGIDLVFAALGADADVLPLVRQYMRIWYLGAAFMAVPMLGNGLLISAGDSRTAGRFMMLGPLLNVILDPIMIFGWFGFPALGVAGAALATVVGQGASTAWLLLLLRKKHGLLVARRWGLRAYQTTIRNILRLGVPSILSMILMPVSTAVITWILSRMGNAAVAAVGAAQRLEMFAFVIPMALGISLTPFVSQNLGAERLDRIRRSITLSSRFAVGYGLGVALTFFLLAEPLAAVFTRDAQVSAIMVQYIRIVSFGYGLMEVHRYSGFVLTGLQKPVSSALLNGLRILGLLLPLSYLGAQFWGVRGVFWARLITDVIMGCLGLIWVRRVCADRQQHRALLMQRPSAG
jgi:putative MATE family efflux protein